MNTENSNLSRRVFLKTTAVGTAGIMAGRAVSFGTEEKKEDKKIPIGVQLYSLRGLGGAGRGGTRGFGGGGGMEVPVAFEGIKKLGYDGVEFAGYYGYDNRAEDMRKLLDDNGLKACGFHLQRPVTPDTILADQFQPTVDYNKTIGNKYLIFPMLSAQGEDGWKKMAEQFNKIAEKLKPLDMYVGYHNHYQEFAQEFGDVTVFDTFFGNNSKDIIIQLDIGHCLRGGGDPVEVIKKYPGRAVTVHVKDYGDTAVKDVVGDGNVKWKEVLQACKDIGGTKWYIIEEESFQFQGLEGIEKSINGLKKILAEMEAAKPA
ncbi:MAG: sugar phosphate isomerase/epimerase [Sedimentisphaerales bacterium]|nr:sugar phosphate isomerase/epimerase [Sedimentisphaerales bacterium]